MPLKLMLSLFRYFHIKVQRSLAGEVEDEGPLSHQSYGFGSPLIQQRRGEVQPAISGAVEATSDGRYREAGREGRERFVPTAWRKCFIHTSK